MSVAFTRLSLWPWGGKAHESTAPTSSLNSSTEFESGFRELDTMKFSSVMVGKVHSPASRRVKRKWQSREQRRIDKEYDAVLVPSDGGCLSGSESDDSDWSIGWMEPHAPDFDGDGEADNSFAVLVPCYDGQGRYELDENSNNCIFDAVNFINAYSSEDKNYMEQWLSSLQNC